MVHGPFPLLLDRFCHSLLPHLIVLLLQSILHLRQAHLLNDNLPSRDWGLIPSGVDDVVRNVPRVRVGVGGGAGSLLDVDRITDHDRGGQRRGYDLARGTRIVVDRLHALVFKPAEESVVSVCDELADLARVEGLGVFGGAVVTS